MSYFNTDGPSGHGAGRLLGHLEGKEEGTAEGYASGHNEGHSEGFIRGRRRGWNDAIAAGNAEMMKQMAYTRDHIAAKEALAQELEKQRALNKRLAANLVASDRNNASFRKANEDLHARLAEANANEKYLIYNCSLVSMNAMRLVLEDIIASGDMPANKVADKFVTHFDAQTKAAQELGSIRVSPEKERGFADASPRACKFIHDMQTTSSKQNQDSD